MKFEFEEIYEGINQFNYKYRSINRAKVFGGWIVFSRSSIDEDTQECMIFIPDPEHKWKIEK